MRRAHEIGAVSSAQPPLQENATRDLARFGARLRFDQIPPEVVARIKSSVLDSLGCCILGCPARST